MENKVTASRVEEGVNKVRRGRVAGSLKGLNEDWKRKGTAETKLETWRVSKVLSLGD